MIDFVYIIVIFAYLLMGLAFFVRDYPLGLLSSMAILISGVYIAVNGIGDTNDILTLAVALINIGIGSYVFLGASLEKIQEVN